MKDYKPKHEWGKFLWPYIHTLALMDSPIVIECIKNVAATIPCGTCRLEFEKALIDITIEQNIFEWTVVLHNNVNKRLGKPEWSFQQAFEEWATKC